ncbi:NAD-dependent dehydratase [Chryseobacterium sp. Leaf404]|uniref:NmrA family NAD(P)-binding protein n=1 Tax=unclassified Chryseobacterium TaxID=2593645 RepID=UPI0006F1F500|nr:MULTISPECIES: NAD(P)H-binding protein [unclassified Chryseobacterium]KQT16489.1 NAD-dependent dehydratase [Chryseobacterium sp. Leaf404]
MKITITGSLGNVAKPLAQHLITEGHEITVITSNENKRNEIEVLGASAAIGSITDVVFLKEAFRGADAVFLITPPMVDATDIIKKTIVIGTKYAEAVAETKVKRLVMLSSVGADSPVDNGPIAGLHHIEQIYSNLENVSSTFLRAGNFYINFYNDIPLIKNAGIIGSNYPAQVKVPLVHPKDIAKAAAEELAKISSDQKIRYVVSDNREAGDVAEVLGNAVGKSDLPWVEMTDAQIYEAMSQSGLPTEMAKLYEEMGRGIRTGVVQKDFIANGSPAAGNVKLEDFAQEFAEKFNS